MKTDTTTDGPRVRNLDRGRPVHVQLPEALHDRLTKTAARLGVSRSLLAREAIQRGFKGAADALRRRADANRAAVMDALRTDKEPERTDRRRPGRPTSAAPPCSEAKRETATDTERTA